MSLSSPIWRNRRQENGNLLRRSSSAFYQAAYYNPDYDCLPNLSNLTGNTVFGAALYPDRARIYGGVAYSNSASGSYITPDSAALDIVGDITFVARFALDDWTPSGIQAVISKYSFAALGKSYRLRVNTDGTIAVVTSPDGSADVTFTSTVAPTVSDNGILWVKVTIDVDNGAAGKTGMFYTSTDETNDYTAVNWTQLGAAVTSAGTTSIYNSTSSLFMCVLSNGSTERMNGRIYYAHIASGIDGAPVSIFNPSSVPNYAYGWTASTGEDWLVNVTTAYQQDWQYKVAPAQLGTTGFYTNARIWGGVAYYTGTNGNYFSTPDAAAFSGLLDIDLRFDGTLTDFTPAAVQTLISHRSGVGSGIGFHFRVATSGALELLVAPTDGSTTSTATSSVVISATDGTRIKLRATRNGTTGDVTFYTSRDYDLATNTGNWTQLGTVRPTTAGALFNSSAALEIGSSIAGTNSPLNGVVYYADVLNSIGGTVVACFNPAIAADMQTSWTGSCGNVWSVTKTTGADTNDPTRLVFSGQKYVYQTGVVGNYTSGADNAAAEITTDIDIRVRLAADDYTTLGALKNVVAKYDIGTGQRSWQLSIETSNTLSLRTSPDGTTAVVAVSTVAQSFADQQLVWLRAHRVLNNGAGGNTTTFFTSTTDTQDPSQVVWTQLGAPVVNAGVTSIFNSTAAITLGCNLASGVSQEILPGKYYYFDARNGVDGVIAAKYDASLASTNGYTDPTNSVVWTHNRSATGKKLSFVDRTLLLLGTDDYLITANHALLNYAAGQSFSVAVANRGFETVVSGGAQAKWAEKFGASYTTTAGWSLFCGANLATCRSYISDASVNAVTTDITQTTGTPALASLSRDVTTDLLNRYVNTSSVSVTDPTTAAITNSAELRWGRDSVGGLQYFNGEMFGMSTFRKALTTTELTKLKTELGAY